ncbi:MAG: 23S rRNA (uracil(1939)-C(5))-methyltransferase RlmD, partial [Candidatus Coproplasma sp.]
MQKNQEYKGKVVALGSEGEGIVQTAEGTAFVPYCLPEEEVSFRALRVKGGVAYGKLTEVHTLSRDRAVPVCPVYEKCGGCQLQHASYSAQLDFKRKLVENCLKKIGGLDREVKPTVSSDKQYSYRNKLALPVGVTEEGSTVVGFFAPRSHRIVPIFDCALQQEWAKPLIAALLKFMRENGVSGYDEHTGKGSVRHVVAREVKGKFIFTVVSAERIDLSPLADILDGQFKKYTLLLNVNRSKGNAIFSKEWHICRGEGFFEGEDCGIKFKAGANTFLQVNDGVRSALYSAVTQEVCDKKSVAIDLYSGGGMLTAMLAKGCKAAYGIEIVKEAVVCADELKELNGLSDKMFNICGTVEENLGAVLERTEGAKRVIVCDPPRKGMERSVIKEIIASGAEKVVLVSCNPATLARDLGLLCGSLIESEGQIARATPAEDGSFAGAYKINSVTPFDMFPQTKHVETLVVLS